ncbi:agmatine deiminase family protein [Gymnodinialimonas hymeniacidonis]|uniref:agmatine deiminase family protein n=1 Tax=Gymnodinialimonas hymeniacidonis TaxID=3126508 RepID=UPI0034C5F2FC
MRMTRRASMGAMAAGLAFCGRAQAQAGGWVMPAEEAPHEATFMQWPVSREVHPDRYFLGILQDTIADIANTIAAFEPVILLMPTEAIAGAGRRLSGDIEIWDIPTEDLWARDSGPVFLTNDAGERAVLSFNFNGWGNKQVHVQDGQIAARVAERMGLPLIDSGVVGEAGGLEQDGAGLVMAHESSWVIDNRNPGLSRDQIGARIVESLGAERMIWAPGLADHDITDYHIDALARFVAPGHALIQLPEEVDPDDPFSAASFQARDILRNAGLRLTEIADPWATRITSADFVASYVNYYVCNSAVIAAQFGDRTADRAAEDTLQALYPDREIIALNVDALGEIGGGIHCATQQMPAV